MVLEPGPANANPADNEAKSNPNMVVVAIVTGSADDKTSTPKAGRDDHWFVRGGAFSFRVQSKFAMDSMVRSMKFSDGTTSLTSPPDPAVPAAPGIFARPMHHDAQLTSTLKVTVERVADRNAPRTTIDPDKPFKVEPIIRQVPLALWGACKPFPHSPLQNQPC